MTISDWITSTLQGGGTLLSKNAKICIPLKDNTTIKLADPDSLDIWAFHKQPQKGAIVLDINSLKKKTPCQTYLARLRDLSGHTIYVLELGASPLLSDQEYIALGYRVHTSIPPYKIYCFNLDNYKKTPDWLNSRHWANPERWNKDRW